MTRPGSGASDPPSGSHSSARTSRAASESQPDGLQGPLGSPAGVEHDQRIAAREWVAPGTSFKPDHGVQLARQGEQALEQGSQLRQRYPAAMASEEGEHLVNSPLCITLRTLRWSPQSVGIRASHRHDLRQIAQVLRIASLDRVNRADDRLRASRSTEGGRARLASGSVACVPFIAFIAGLRPWLGLGGLRWWIDRPGLGRVRLARGLRWRPVLGSTPHRRWRMTLTTTSRATRKSDLNSIRGVRTVRPRWPYRRPCRRRGGPCGR